MLDHEPCKQLYYYAFEVAHLHELEQVMPALTVYFAEEVLPSVWLTFQKDETSSAYESAA